MPPGAIKLMTCSTFWTQRSAWEWLDAQIAELTTHTGTTTIEQFVEVFWTNGGIRPRTEDQQKRLSRIHVRPDWGTTPLSAITR